MKPRVWQVRVGVLTLVMIAATCWAAFALGTGPGATDTPDAVPSVVLPAVVADNGSSGPLTLINPTAYVLGTDVPQITQTYGTTIVTTPEYIVYRGVACADFVNHGLRPVTKATFAFSAAGSDGIILDVTSSSINGLFAIDDTTRSGVERAHVCLEYLTSLHPVIGRFLINSGPGRFKLPIPVAEILVSPKQVTYDDGTTWQAQQTMQQGDRIASVASPSPSPASPGWPIVVAENVASAPFRIMDAFTYDPEQGVTFHRPIPQFGVCVALDTGDAAKVKQAQVAVAFVAGDGTEAGVDTITTHGGRYYGECRGAPGSVKDGTFIYHVKRGRTSTPISRVIVTQLSEDFADGTSWKSDSPPADGLQLLHNGK